MSATATGLVRQDFLSFDRHQFDGRRRLGHAVTQESRIAWADFHNMHIARARSSSRQTLTPEWSESDVQMREIVLQFLECRFFLRKQGGTNAERLEAIEAASAAQIPKLEATLKRLLLRYNEAARCKMPQRGLDMLATQVQNLDAQICMQRRGIAGVVASVAYLHFRLMYKSPEVAEKVGIKPPMVRIWAHRMQLIAREVVQGVQRKTLSSHKSYHKHYTLPVSKLYFEPTNKWPLERLQKLYKLREEGKSWKEIAEAMKLNIHTANGTYRRFFAPVPSRHKERTNG